MSCNFSAKIQFFSEIIFFVFGYFQQISVQNDTLFVFILSEFFLHCFYCFGWWVGRAEKWRNPFFGVGGRCGVSAANTAKANCLSLLVSLSFFSNLSSCAKLSTLFFFVSALLLGCARIATNEAAAWQQWRVSIAAGTRATAAKLNKIWDEPSPPLRQTAC